MLGGATEVREMCPQPCLRGVGVGQGLLGTIPLPA